MLRRLFGFMVSCVAAGSFLAGTAFGQADVASEYEVKAAFLFNFVRFVEWPASVSDAPRPIVIGFIGDDPFDPQMLDGLGHKNVNGRALTIRHFKDVREIDCDVLFVGAMKDKNMQTILDAVSKRSILTVGEDSKFLSAGGMIRFCIRDKKIRFEVNLTPVATASLKLSAKLLAVAIIVH